MAPMILAAKARKDLDKAKAAKLSKRVREIQADLGLSRLPPHPDAKRKRDIRVQRGLNS